MHRKRVNSFISARRVVPNLNLSPAHIQNQNVYCSNAVKSRRYTLASIIPVSMLIQFSKVINVFYLFCVLLNCIPEISTNKPIFTLIPLCAVIMGGMCQEIWADFKRWKQDRYTN